MISEHPSAGYIALMSAIIISATLLIITFTMSFSSYFVRFNILDSEFKRMSEALAEACFQTAILKLENNPAWKPLADGTQVTVDGATKVCKICEVNGSTQKNIKTRAVYQKAYTNLDTTITPTIAGITINSWNETPDYTGAANCPVFPIP